MLTHRCLVLLSLLVVAIASLASANNDELACTTSASASQDELLDTMVNGHRRLVFDPDLNGPNTDSAKATFPTNDSETGPSEYVEGHNRRFKSSDKGDGDKDDDKGDDKGDKGDKKDKCDCDKKGGKKGCCHNQPATPTYHISLGNEDKRYQTISLPAQGCPFVYGDDMRSSLPPLLKPGCCQSPHVERMARVRLREYATIPATPTATIWNRAAKTRHPIATLLRAAAPLLVAAHLLVAHLRASTHSSAALRLGTAVAAAMVAMVATDAAVAVAMAVVVAVMKGRGSKSHKKSNGRNAENYNNDSNNDSNNNYNG
ncbi:hypothetical protein GGH93_001136 [Coemansia aciculifera]|nr:hypothetical protein GGH93_001136 [Coemansia aciculifera]